MESAIEKIDNIEYLVNDQLNTILALIPYLQHRKEIALDWEKNPHPEKLKLIEHLNNNIRKILCV